MIFYYIGLSLLMSFLLAVSYIFLKLFFEFKFSKKVTLLGWGILSFLFFLCSFEKVIGLLGFKILYFSAAVLISALMLFQGKTIEKIKVVAVLIAYYLFLVALVYLSYRAFSPDWMHQGLSVQKCFFYAFTESLLVVGSYKLIFDLISKKERIKKVYFYQNIFMLSIIILEVMITTYIIINSIDTNAIRMTLISISLMTVLAFDCGLIAFLNKMEKNYLLKQNLELQEQQMIMQEEYYEKIHDQYEETIDLIQNMKTYILSLKQYYEKGEKEKAKDYTATILEEISKTGLHYACKDKILAVILEDKHHFCVERGITLTVKDRSDGLAFITPFDITTIFTNLLDNAIQGVEAICKPEITLELIKQGEMLVIIVENPIKNKPIKKSGRFISTKAEKGHGLGLKNVETAVKKYHGSMDIHFDENSFSVQILMPIG